jgi:uncharacterized membrane protein YozB (DUF420 family)
MSIHIRTAPDPARYPTDRPRRPRWRRAAGALLVGVSFFYALFALSVAAQTAAAPLGLAEPAPTRAAPPLFVVHAVTGAVALLTIAAYICIRTGAVRRHREWMIRSFALAAFFITLSVWDPLLAALPLPPETAFATAVVLGWLVNLIAAELWIRRSRRGRSRR